MAAVFFCSNSEGQPLVSHLEFFRVLIITHFLFTVVFLGSVEEE
jgi:hypothetical protein